MEKFSIGSMAKCLFFSNGEIYHLVSGKMPIFLQWRNLALGQWQNPYFSPMETCSTESMGN